MDLVVSSAARNSISVDRCTSWPPAYKGYECSGKGSFRDLNNTIAISQRNCCESECREKNENNRIEFYAF